MNKDSMMSAFLGELNALNDEPKELPSAGDIRNRFSELLWMNVEKGHYDTTRAEQLVLTMGNLSDSVIYQMYEIMVSRYGEDL